MKVLGMWVWPQNVYMRGAEKVVDSCAAAGVTDLYFLTKGLAGTVSFLSSFAPMAYDRDLLRELLAAAHKRGMRVHAWFTSASDEHYKQGHPESGRYHFVRGRDRGLISLADQGYLSYMERIVQEVCRCYEVDGIHLDYIRYNHLLYGWAEEDLRRYQLHGADQTALKALIERTFYKGEEQCIFDAYRKGDGNVLALAKARRTDVVRFARSLTQAARAQKNHLALSAALMPEGAYDDTAFSDLHYGQNYEDAAELFDAALPMAYSKAYEKDAEWVAEVARGTLKRGLRTVIGLHAYEGATASSLNCDFQAVQKTAAEGVCLFREGATVLAQMRGSEVLLDNMLDEDITQLMCLGDEEGIEVIRTIKAGERKTLRLPFIVKEIRAFCSGKEACVFMYTK